MVLRKNRNSTTDCRGRTFVTNQWQPSRVLLAAICGRKDNIGRPQPHGIFARNVNVNDYFISRPKSRQAA